MVMEMNFTEIIAAFITMPAGQGIAYSASVNRFVKIKIPSRL
jgi:hypothetical protein